MGIRVEADTLEELIDKVAAALAREHLTDENLAKFIRGTREGK